MAVHIQDIIPVLHVKLHHPDGLAIEGVAHTLLFRCVIPSVLHVGDTPVICGGALVWLGPRPEFVVGIPGHIRVHCADLVAYDTTLDGASDCHVGDAPGMDPEVAIGAPTCAPTVGCLDVLHRALAVFAGDDAPTEGIDSMVGSVVPCAHTEHPAV